MKRIRPFFAPAIYSLLMLGWMPGAVASTGTLVVLEDTTLTEDHLGEIVLGADDVTLDCDGHSVIAPETGDGVGIFLAGCTGVTVENCVVTGFGIGIGLAYSPANEFHRNEAIENLVGFLLTGSAGNIFSRNEAVGNPDSGFLLDGNSSNNSFWRNDSTGNGTGFLVTDSPGNRLVRNTANQNLHGFFITSHSDASFLFLNVANDNGSEISMQYGTGFLVRGFGQTLDRNTANRNSGNGFGLQSLADSAVIRNRARENDFDGLSLWLSSNNVLEKNRTDSNDRYGVSLLSESSYNAVVRNKACHNGEVDAYQSESSTGNEFSKNHFCSTSGL